MYIISADNRQKNNKIQPESQFSYKLQTKKNCSIHYSYSPGILYIMAVFEGNNDPQILYYVYIYMLVKEKYNNFII